jgi:hypothetical protein
MTRKGKIARLPREIREELNRRLEDGAGGESLLDWLNALPAVQSVVAGQFAGVPISKQNLSEWRTGGFAEWQARQEMMADARELAADAAELQAVTGGQLTDHLATVLGARYASALAGWDGQPGEEFRQKLKVLRGMCQDIVELRRGDHSGARLQMDRERMEQKREKTDAEVVAQFEEWAEIPAVKDWICQDWVSPEERRRRLLEIFGRTPEPEESTAPDPAPGSAQPDQVGVPAGDASGSDQTAPPNPVGEPANSSLKTPSVEAGSNQVKPSQTKNGLTSPQPSLLSGFPAGRQNYCRREEDS